MQLNYRQAVMAVIVNKNNQVLIGTSPRDGGFKFPQGGIDSNESNVDAIIRELKEELDLDLNKDNILLECNEKVSYEFNKSSQNIYNKFDGQEQVVFKIKYRNYMKLEPQDDEFDKLIWINPKDLKNYDTRHRTKAYNKALEICKLL